MAASWLHEKSGREASERALGHRDVPKLEAALAGADRQRQLPPFTKHQKGSQASPFLSGTPTPTARGLSLVTEDKPMFAFNLPPKHALPNPAGSAEQEHLVPHSIDFKHLVGTVAADGKLTPMSQQELGAAQAAGKQRFKQQKGVEYKRPGGLPPL